VTPDPITSSDLLVPELVPMAQDGPDVCPLCRSGRTRPDRLCFSCERTSAQVPYPCELVIPISYYTTPSPLRDRMHDYKEHQDPAVREEQSHYVAAILARYFLEHHDALTARFGAWDEVVAVPSTHHDNRPALQTAIERNFPDAIGRFTRPLEHGPGAMTFNQASPTGFVPVDGSDISGRSMLLVDDTYTTGARLQSAHHGLVAAGSTVVAAIVVTRKINPDPRYGSDHLWERQTAEPFDFSAPPWWAQS
jgi:predicted amidophosphoribosyltransferase